MKGTVEPTMRDKLEELLTVLDLTNTDAARLCGVHQTTISRWMTLQAPIPYSVIRMLELMIVIDKSTKMIKVWWASPEEVDIDRNRGTEDAA